jgi:hypothetical protein
MYTMPNPAPRPSHDRWRDIDGIHIALFCMVEQVAECAEPEVLPSRLYQRGQVVGRGLDSLYVRFADNALVGLPPQLVPIHRRARPMLMHPTSATLRVSDPRSPRS